MLRSIFTVLSVFIIDLTFGQVLCLPKVANDLEKTFFDNQELSSPKKN